MPLLPIEIQILTLLLTQTGTNDPQQKILHNTTTNTITWTRTNTGDYTGTLTTAINTDKTWIICNNGFINTWTFNIRIVDPTTIQLQTAIAGTLTDGILLNTPIELRIYN